MFVLVFVCVAFDSRKYCTENAGSSQSRIGQASCLFIAMLHSDLSSTLRKSVSPPSTPMSTAANTQVQRH